MCVCVCVYVCVYVCMHITVPPPPQIKPAGAKETGWYGGRALVRALVTIKAAVTYVPTA